MAFDHTREMDGETQVELLSGIDTFVRRFVSLIGQDAQMFAVLQRFSREFLALADRTATQTVVSPAAEVVADRQAVEQPTSLSAPQSGHIELPSVPGIEVPVSAYRRLIAKPGDPQLIEARCHVKAEAAKWAAVRQGKMQEGADYFTEIAPKEKEFIGKANALTDCFLWMCHTNGPLPVGLWEAISGCFEAAAMAVSLLQQLIEDGMGHNGFLKKALEVAAEAQSALRMAVETVNEKPDNDQVQIHHWIKQIADEKRIVIRRHMSLDDGADPTRWADLQDRISQFASEIDRIRKQAKQRTKLLAKAQYHARVIGEGHGTVDDRRKIVEVVDALVSDGVPPSSIDLRDLLVPIIYDISDVEAPSTFQRVMGEVERHLVSEACRGKTLFVIGEYNSRVLDTLKAAFCLKEIVGVPVGEDEAISYYASQPDVAAVLLVVWGGDAFFHEMEALCGQHGKKVFLSNGCAPNQVAHGIFQQWRENRRAHPGAASVNRAIQRGCEAAFGMPKELRCISEELPDEERRRLKKLAAEWRAKHCWSPNQLRHAAGTEVRRQYGLEAAQVVLGHAKADVTQVYAERDLALAAQIMQKLG